MSLFTCLSIQSNRTTDQQRTNRNRPYLLYFSEGLLPGPPGTGIPPGSTVGRGGAAVPPFNPPLLREKTGGCMVLVGGGRLCGGGSCGQKFWTGGWILGSLAIFSVSHLLRRSFCQSFKFLDVLGPAWTHLDLLGRIEIRSDAYSCAQMVLFDLGQILKIHLIVCAKLK